MPPNTFVFNIHNGEKWVSKITEVTANGTVLDGQRIPFDPQPGTFSDYIFLRIMGSNSDYSVIFFSEGYLSKLDPGTQTVTFNIKATGYLDKKIVVNIEP